jgi:1-piperideine-2-carboxylate/1-pyrroline-2-carboxylate reductase [NAD(P)H]
MEVLDARETAARLPYLELADFIREVMDGRRDGKLDAPSRVVLSLPEGGKFLVMPAADDGLAITKLVTVIPGTRSVNCPPSRAR